MSLLFDPTKLKPAPIYPTIALLNNFLINTHTFLNSFSENIEKKISSVSTKITQLEILLSIIEAKLNSIPDISDVTQPVSSSMNGKDNIDSNSLPLPPPSQPPSQPPSSFTSIKPEKSTQMTNYQVEVAKAMEATDEKEEEKQKEMEETSLVPEGKVMASNHPNYIPFMKMLKVGVPGPVVATKLTSMGLDPSVVDNPSKLIDL